MEIVASREHLLPVLSRCASVVERRQTLPILGNLYLSAEDASVVVVGTDLEVQVRARCPAQVISAGETSVPARKLADIVRNLPDGSEVRLKVSGDRCVVTAGRGRYSLGTLPGGDFPLMRMDSEAEVLDLDEGALKGLLEKTGFAMAQQDVRYYLNGLFLEVREGDVRGVATDGHRLARFDLPAGLSPAAAVAVIVPFKTVNELRRGLGSAAQPLVMRVGEKTIEFESGDTVVTSKLVDGRYPDHERVVPIHLTRRAVVDRGLLRGALTRAAVLSNEKYRGVRLSFEPGTLRLQAHNPEKEEAQEELEMNYEGDPVTIGFNVAYLGDVLGAVDVDSIEILFEDGNSSSVWRGLGCEREIFVVMPMRL